MNQTLSGKPGAVHYCRFTLSYRDVEDLLAERGLDISYETVRRWVLKFGRAYARRIQRLQRLPEERFRFLMTARRRRDSMCFLPSCRSSRCRLALCAGLPESKTLRIQPAQTIPRLIRLSSARAAFGTTDRTLAPGRRTTDRTLAPGRDGRRNSREAVLSLACRGQ